MLAGLPSLPSVDLSLWWVRLWAAEKKVDWVWMVFGVVSGVDSGICVLDEVNVPQGKGEVLGFWYPFVSMGICHCVAGRETYSVRVRKFEKIRPTNLHPLAHHYLDTVTSSNFVPSLVLPTSPVRWLTTFITHYEGKSHSQLKPRSGNLVSDISDHLFTTFYYLLIELQLKWSSCCSSVFQKGPGSVLQKTVFMWLVWCLCWSWC